ncbi:hypothetical protein P3X46_032374 [Hevea brasiliensis]|uniref:Reverse transcriptase zinc-binding domain-containing protein n=1 Tax=Hevea brasiliensis TaxID=3981 RepID=A0ABQ9KD47_HEVBR|nr:hypothetical protein P3X46_032374 [Hevea brasiliensis]
MQSLYSCLINASTQVSFCSSSLWQGLAPPKVELLVWLAYRDHLCYKGWLSSINVISPSQSGCPFCFDASKSISHLFLHCYHSWRVSNWLFSWRDLKFCLPKTVDAFLNEWNSLCYGNFQRKFWLKLFYAIVSSLWLSRNDIIFNNKEMDTISLCSLILFRVATWMRALDASFPFSGADLLVTTDAIKLGIGGVLRDSFGNIICLFSCFVGIIDSNAVELLAISKALKVSVSKQIFSSISSIIIESDSMNVVS